EDRDPDDVGGQEVRRELDAGEAAPGRARERGGEGRLADTGDVLEEQVSPREKRRQRQPHGLRLSAKRARDLVEKPLDRRSFDRQRPSSRGRSQVHAALSLRRRQARDPWDNLVPGGRSCKAWGGACAAAPALAREGPLRGPVLPRLHLTPGPVTERVDP